MRFPQNRPRYPPYMREAFETQAIKILYTEKTTETPASDIYFDQAICMCNFIIMLTHDRSLLFISRRNLFLSERINIATTEGIGKKIAMKQRYFHKYMESSDKDRYQHHKNRRSTRKKAR